MTDIDTAARQVCNPDTRFVRQLFDSCRAHAPDCTVEEVVSVIETKIAIKRGRTVGNWMGYLLTAVAAQFEGESFRQFRASSAMSKHDAEGATSQTDEWRVYLEHNAAALPPGYEDIATSLRELIVDHVKLPNGDTDFEALGQRLTALEERMIEAAYTRQNEREVFESSQEVLRQLRPHRGKMSAEQLSSLERHYRKKDLLDKAGLPRLSLYDRH